MTDLNKVKEAFAEVIRISDRKHDAWDDAKAALVELKTFIERLESDELVEDLAEYLFIKTNCHEQSYIYGVKEESVNFVADNMMKKDTFIPLREAWNRAKDGNDGVYLRGKTKAREFLYFMKVRPSIKTLRG